MKRQREDPNSYLGGDLVASFEDDASDTEGKKKMTKAERNEARKIANKKWKTTDRKVGSGKDPNPRHTIYYQSQIPVLRDEEEWVKFQNALNDPLPVTVRIGGACPVMVEQWLQRSMDQEFKTMRGRFVEINGNVLKDNIVKRVPWAGHNVWQIAADSATLARNPGLESLSKLLLREVSLGHVVRQELASMIPAIMLKVESHHNVLDVCAAPGSKTEQLLTLLNANRPDKSLPAQGMVVANDADPIRINTLKKRYARAGSPNLLVTCARAEDLQKMINKPVFDRIVADVPCSGDGTIRKFPHIWRLFRPRMSLELHLVQLQIAIASVLLLKPGGRLVYSTCSINPLEDEAVVCALLRHYWGRLVLVDTRAEGILPGLITRPGQSHWESSEDIFVVGETDEASRKASLARLPKLTPSMQPPTSNEAKIMHLERSHRILPQDNDTGGFFVAVLHWLDTEASVDPLYTSTDPEFATNNTVYSTTSKKKTNIVSAQASVDIMKNLGYNPKHTQNNHVSTSANEKTSGGVKTKTPAVTATTAMAELAKVTATAKDTVEVDEIDKNVIYTTLSNSEYKHVTTSVKIDSTMVLPTENATASTTSSLFLVQSQVTDSQATALAQLAQAKKREEIAKQGTFSGFFGSRAKGWAKPVVTEEIIADVRPVTTTRISLVSSNIHTALTSWAAGEPTYLRQAGVAVVDVADPVTSDTSDNSKGDSAVSKSTVPFSNSKSKAESKESKKMYTVIPDGASALRKAISTTSVESTDFQFVLKYALEANSTNEDASADAIPATSTPATTNNSTSIDVTALFEQATTLVDPNYDPDTIAENMDLEGAKLQVALVSSVSGEGLATLAKVYAECVQRLKKGGDSVVNVLLTTTNDNAGVGAAGSNAAADSETTAGGEKRRLSKAERKKQKTGAKPAAVAATSIASSTSSNNATIAVGANNKPAVLLLQVTVDKEN
eukprot:gene9272-10930_t